MIRLLTAIMLSIAPPPTLTLYCVSVSVDYDGQLYVVTCVPDTIFADSFGG